MNRLTRVDECGDIYMSDEYKDMDGDDWDAMALGKLVRYEKLEESGKLIELPCSVGDIVYKEITQHDSYDDSEYKIISAVCFRLDMLKDFGKSVFLTRDEAEEKLKEMK